MADININLINRLGKGQKSSGNRNSVAKNSEKVKNSKNTFNLGKYSSDIMGGVSSGSGKTLGGVGSSISKMGGVGSAVVASAVLANKGADLYISYQTAKTGQSLYYGNVKSSKDMIFSLGTNYLFGLAKNEVFTKNIVRRQNASLEYGRELYNYNNYGSKYKAR